MSFLEEHSTVAWGMAVAAALWLISYLWIVPTLRTKALRSKAPTASRFGSALEAASATRDIAAGVLLAGVMVIAASSLARAYLQQIDIADLVMKTASDARQKIVQLVHGVELGSDGRQATLPGQTAPEDMGAPDVERSPTLTGFNDAGERSFTQSDWSRAAASWRQSTATLARRSRLGVQDAGATPAEDADRADRQYIGLVKAVNRLAAQGSEPAAQASREMFWTAQWALGFEGQQPPAFGGRSDPRLAELMRQHQDLVAQWHGSEALRDAKTEAANAAQLGAIEAQLAAVDAKLEGEFPDYAEFAKPEPLAVEVVQARLGEDEALVLFLDTPEQTPTPEETFIWAVTKTDARWVRSELGRSALTRQVQALRCGLDEEQWANPASAGRCGDLLGLNAAPDASRPLPFDLAKAHGLYRALFGQIEDMIAGKRLFVVPSGPLTSLPFHVLVAKEPATALPDRFEGYRDVAWLASAHAMTTLPAVASLTAPRQDASFRPAAGTYAGYGQPLLSGAGSSCRETKAPSECPLADAAHPRDAVDRATIPGGGGRSANATMDKVFVKGSTPEALLTQVRSLCPLPGSAYEIKCIAERYKEKAPLIRLEGEARETDIKALSQSGRLAGYRILHFATHGLLSGKGERMATRLGEPALVLTPPEKPADADDDGLLMASEIAALKLDADWVVLSASNTAAGDQIGAEALSGLARAFLYAGGRALLVSHWPAYPEAAVRLATSAFAELARHPQEGRAKALQYAMSDLMGDRSQAENAHPAVWAPFVVVGEGGR